MKVMVNPGVDNMASRLASLAVSAINGCGTCLALARKDIARARVGAQGVQSALKISAAVLAVAVTLEQSNPENA